LLAFLSKIVQSVPECPENVQGVQSVQGDRPRCPECPGRSSEVSRVSKEIVLGVQRGCQVSGHQGSSVFKAVKVDKVVKVA